MDVMERMALSAFLENCTAVLEEVHRSRQPVLITRSGEPVAEIVPPPPSNPQRPWLGSLRGTGRITGDIISPAADASDWDVLRT
jgi:antitoxin (DNA-binding transcriptional repressor) of toxin-antitoxin stability system